MPAIVGATAGKALGTVLTAIARLSSNSGGSVQPVAWVAENSSSLIVPLR